MANHPKGEVGFDADGKRYRLLFSTNAIVELEDQLGGGVEGIGALVSGGKRFKAIRTALWCGLSDNHPDLTLKDAGRIIDSLGIAEADRLVGEAFALAFPPPTVEEGRPLATPAPAPRAQTG